jgi:uncharacterized membrane protein YhaH (DUF805 family)
MAMLSFVFGFNARISRLQFLLASLALGLAMAVFVFFFAFAFGLQGASRMRPVDIVASWPVLIAIAVFLFATFTLQSMRFRDIGWDPVCVIPAWFALVIIDHFMAVKFSALSIGREHSHTAVGALVNLGLYLALLSWPGGEFSELRQSGATSPPPPPSPDRSAARLGAVTGATGGFGRRTR